jgi:HSP20 family protein
MPTKEKNPKPTQIATRSQLDTWTEFDRMFDDLRHRLYDTFGVTPLFGPTLTSFAPLEARVPALRTAAADVADTGKSYKILAEVPGITKDQLDIRVRGSLVEIKAESSKSTEKKDSDFVRRERTYEGFYRALELPEPVVATDAKAKLENGILELELPKQNPTPSPEEVKIAVH